MSDAIKNFVIVEVSTGYDDSATTVVLESGHGAKLPDPAVANFNLVWWNATDYPDPADDPDVEIPRVTARTTDTLTIVRPAVGNSYNGETSDNTAKNHNTAGKTYKMILAPTYKTFNDINTAIRNEQLKIENGWIDANETWTYASADDPTYTFTISGDKTGKYSAGMRIKLTQTTAKYFIITAVSYSSPNTTVTVYGGTDYDLANATITSPYYSMVKAPHGFPLAKSKWTVIKTDTSRRTQTTPTASTWYNLTNLNIVAPIGCWDAYYKANLQAFDDDSLEDAVFLITLSTANNSESNAKMTYTCALSAEHAASSGYLGSVMPTSAIDQIEITTKTTLYLNIAATTTDLDSINVRGDYGTTVISLVCAYL